MVYLIIGVLIILFIFNTYLSVLNYRHRHQPIPANVRDVYDEKDYKRWLDYTMEGYKLQMISRTINLIFMLTLFFVGFFPWLASRAMDLTGDMIFQNMIFLGVYGVLSYLINLGFSSYRTFHIEEAYGFNKTTIKTFILDQFRMLLMAALIGGGLIYLILYLYIWLGTGALVYTWFIIMGFTLLINILYTRVFIRLFNKLTPLPEGDLYDQCMSLGKGEGYEIRKISMMDASKRSTRLNAFFTGFGRFKNIVLYDTLLDKCSNDEIVAILAHEIGHGKHKDVLKNLFISAFQMAAYLAILSLFLQSDTMALAFGFNGVHYGFAMIVFGILLEPVGILIGVPLSLMSRKAEFKADAFAASTGYRDAMISALKKLAKENFSNLTPHPMVVLITYSHPPVAKRIEALVEHEGRTT